MSRSTWRAIAATLSALWVLLSLFASQTQIYNAHTHYADYTLQRIDNTMPPAQVDTPFWFSYDSGGRTVRLETSEALEIRFYQLAADRSATEAIDPDANAWMSGNLIAISPMQARELELDGVRERVLCQDATRTDFGDTAFDPAPHILDSPDIPFELVFAERNRILVRFAGESVTDSIVYISDAHAKQQRYTTDAHGYISHLPLSDIRHGFTALYRPDATHVYRMHYVVEDYGYATGHFLRAQIPLLLVCGFAACGIAILQLCRIRFQGPARAFTGYRLGETGLAPSDARFLALRWGILVLSMFVFTYLGHLTGLGQALNYIVLPVFSCPFDLDQITEVPCYYLSHLPSLAHRFGDTLPGRNLLYVFAFFASLLVSIVLFGRILCGFVCPAGLLQDVMDKLRQLLHIRPVTVSDEMSHGFTVMKWVWIFVFFGFAFTGGDFCSICPLKVFTTAQAGFWTNLTLNGVFAGFLLIGSFFIHRFWCLMCPLGYVMGLLSRFNLFQLKKDCTACTSCGGCYEACPMRLKHIYTEQERTDIQTVDCLMCGECVRHCPEDGALCITCCGKKLYTSSRSRFLQRYAKTQTGGHTCPRHD